jgi:hypothetical protein
MPCLPIEERRLEEQVNGQRANVDASTQDGDAVVDGIPGFAQGRTCRRACLRAAAPFYGMAMPPWFVSLTFILRL